MPSREEKEVAQMFERTGGCLQLAGIYRVYLGKRQGLEVWIVDGARVAEEIYPGFVMGGNDQRYRFNPEGEIWIDNRIGVSELEYTIAHELVERQLMCREGWSYDKAHIQGGLAREQKMRADDRRLVAHHVADLPPASLGDVGESVQGRSCRLDLEGVYILPFRRVKNLSVWIVNGGRVRRGFDGDFCFAGHDLRYRFIPAKEIWLDSAMSCEEAHFSLVHELAERRRMEKTGNLDDAYVHALAKRLKERRRQTRLVEQHEKSLASVSYGVRDRGVKRKRCGERVV